MSLCVWGLSGVQITCGITVLATILSAPACRRAADDLSPADARAEAEAWRSKHEADYRDAWVTIAGLHFLDAGTHSVGSAPSNDIVLDGAPAVLGRFTLD